MTKVMVAPVQNEIKRTLSEPGSVKYVRRVLQDDPSWGRTALAEHLCEVFGFYDVRGQRQRDSCLKALRKLESQGAFMLPCRRTKSGPSGPRRLGKPVPPAEGVPEQVAALGAWRLVKVTSDEHRRLWNELMICEHPQGHGPLMGRQLRYLIHSEHGWLGGVGFASSALNLADRDGWIGWDRPTRLAHLDKVVSLSRFLIRPGVQCHNLASCVLGRCLRRFPRDFEEQYGYRPWLLETFVEEERFSGTIYRACNWVYVGSTKGRGRQDHSHEQSQSIKGIYVYPLVADLRERMGLDATAGGSALRVEEWSGENWVQEEFGQVELGDRRRTDRLVRIVSTKAAHPTPSFLPAAGGDLAKVKGYYRFVDHEDEEALSMETILRGHRDQTLRRMASESRVLAIHDETDLEYAGLRECEGLGTIGKNQTGTATRGLCLHSTLVVTAETGLPLGVVRADCYARQLRPDHKGKDARQIPLEDKETLRWVEGLQEVRALSKRIPNTGIIHVMDREADFFELFDDWRESPSGHLLVRAMHDRRIGEPSSLFESVSHSPVCHRMVLEVCRRSARPKKGRRAALPARPARKATMAIRYRQVELQPPHDGLNRHKAPIAVWIIHAVEEAPPEGQERLEWYLLTTIPIDSPERALECLKWYRFRWRIEDWHKILQSGCGVEELQNDTAERIKRVMAMDLVISWHIHLMTLLGREAPELPAHLLFTELEIEALCRVEEAESKKKERNRGHG